MNLSKECLSLKWQLMWFVSQADQSSTQSSVRYLHKTSSWAYSYGFDGADWNGEFSWKMICVCASRWLLKVHVGRFPPWKIRSNWKLQNLSPATENGKKKYYSNKKWSRWWVLDEVFAKFCQNQGIHHQYSVHRTSQQNGVFERKNYTL